MRLRSFTGRTMREAMDEVRRQLGAEAVILATEEDAEGGMRVTAALDPADLPAGAPGAPDPIDTLGTALAAHGIAADLVERILTAAFPFETSDPATALAGALGVLYRFAPIAAGQDRRLILCGPPGAGKTASIAKLAARSVLAGNAVRLVSTDRARAGGTEELAAHARILNLPLAVADTSAALAATMSEGNGAALTLIDTPGINPFSAGERLELLSLIEASGAEPILVLPAGGDAVDTYEAASLFQELGCSRLIATRLDLARRLGSLVAAVDALGLTYCEAGTGSAIADGLTRCDPALLARLIVSKRLRGQDRPREPRGLA